MMNVKNIVVCCIFSFILGAAICAGVFIFGTNQWNIARTRQIRTEIERQGETIADIRDSTDEISRRIAVSAERLGTLEESFSTIEDANRGLTEIKREDQQSINRIRKILAE